MNGLWKEIREELKLPPAITLSDLMNNTRMIDEKNQALAKGVLSSTSSSQGRTA